MFLEHREKEENKRQATAGYDLTDAYAQISYCLPGEPCPKTISLQADQEQYLIPALLVRTESAGSGSDWRGFSR